ncbi:MAG: pyrroline-5-carboxylate reductase [Myxococcota bacterium]
MDQPNSPSGSEHVAILGCGTLGEAILQGLLAAPQAPQVRVVTVRRDVVAERLAKYPVDIERDTVVAVGMANIAILAVKPKNARDVLTAPGVAQALQGKVLVSLCAGVTTAQLNGWVPDAHLIRAMPNTPSLIREGMTVLAPGPRATPEQLALVQRIFTAVGRCRILDETHLDAVTGLSGSGPAFACVILEALADGGVRMGLPRDVAVELAAQTVQGAARMVLQTNKHPAALKDEVTTPAGCTIAGLLTMEDGKIRSVLARTIEEATRTAGGLGQERS